ncbi:preprotein translocase subunit SecG [Crateriforma conspicua]|uniref:Protein-export membrane protein SecG n=1 Tax=Crateriforma conspicua TaxID=2527996 RepID=A0A5C5Y640_9PLAN|nr:preprotein translocase subunit SecG [Crateriforma conspicua]TWT71157.1 preprotein translocase subunit SecG [Crateriforma conspicua]
MNLMILGSFAGVVLGTLMAFLSLFLILLVLVQRGRGGGLTGALGGPGGQSAFGSKAGDTFTVITVVVAAVWAFTCAFTMWLLGTHTLPVADNTPAVSSGPGDDADETTDGLNIPTGDSLGLGGLSVGDDASDSANENVQLTPADGGDAAADADADADDQATESNTETAADDEAVSDDATNGDDAGSQDGDEPTETDESTSAE